MIRLDEAAEPVVTGPQPERELRRWVRWMRWSALFFTPKRRTPRVPRHAA